MRKKNIYLSDIQQEPILFPFEISWRDICLSKVFSIHELFKFLQENYIEDNNSIYRFNYSHEFLNFNLKIPYWHPFFSIALTFSRGSKLIGSIMCVPKTIAFEKFLINSSEINYLCLIKKIRSTRLVSTLIQEITRRLNAIGCLHALYTTAVSFHEPFVHSRYYHYPLNIFKLYNLAFMKSRCFVTRTGKFDWKKTNIKLLEQKKSYIRYIVRKNLTKLKAYTCFMDDEFECSFNNVEGVFYLFFFSSSKKNNVKCISFYSLPNKIIKKEKNTYVFTAYWYFGYMKTAIIKCCQNIIMMLKILGFDLFNIVESINEKKNLKLMGFKKGTGFLQFHIFNWIQKPIACKDNGLVTF